MPAKNLRRVAEGGTYSHVYNKGVENRTIFEDEADYQVFLSFLEDYLSAPKAHESTKTDFTIKGRAFKGVPHQPKNYFNKVELVAYCLKPDHFHLLLHQKKHKSLQAFIRSLCTRYSIYFNKKYNRAGSLFDGPYKSVHIRDEENLALLAHHLHKHGDQSSFPEFSGHRETPWVKTKVVLATLSGQGDYSAYINNYKPSEEEKKLLGEISIESAGHLERRDLQEVSLKPWSRIPELLTASAVFVLLLGFSLIKITTAAESSQVLSVKNTDGTSPVNILKIPAQDSEKIGEAHDGDIFEYVSKNSDWYKIKLPDGSNGFIFSTYIETEETN